MRWIKRFGFLTLVLMVLAVASYWVLPWKPWLEAKLRAAVEAKGITPAALTIDWVGLHGVVLRDVSLGEPPLKLAQLTVAYAPLALWRGEIGEVTLRGLTLEATQADTGWNITGLEALKSPPSSEKKVATIPVSAAELAALPTSAITLREAMLNLTAPAAQASLLFDATWRSTPNPSLQLTASGLNAKFGENALSTGAAQFPLALDEAASEWRGDWSIATIHLTSESLILPTLGAQGTLRVKADAVQLKGTLADAKKTHQAAFQLDYSLSKPETSRLRVERASLPWGGGIVAVNDVSLPLAEKKPITFTLEVRKVELASLMQALTGDRATATGVVNGAIPVTLTGSGELRLGQGTLKAEEPGVISLSPEAIPGDNPQVGLVRDVLKNLHYSVLALELSMGEDHALLAKLSVEGKNPDVEAGRPIKLNVNLSGDLLNLLLQNMKLMTDPTQFIEQNAHENPAE